MMIGPKVRTSALAIGTGLASSAATVLWMSSRAVDLYAMVDQLNKVVVDITTLFTTASAFLAAAALVYKSTVKSLTWDVKEIAKEPGSPLKGVITEDTPEGRALAQMPGPVVVAGSPAAQALAKPQ